MRSIGLVGPGVLGRTLAMSLPAETHPIGPVLSSSKVSARRAVREMKRGYVVTDWSGLADVGAILVTVPQVELASVLEAARQGLPRLSRKRILITGLAGGCAAGLAIDGLRSAGAQIGGLLPIALYRRPSFVAPDTTFAVWGDPGALREARSLVHALRGKQAAIDPAGDANVLLAIALVTGALSTSLELAVRRLVHAGVVRKRAIEALAPLAESCMQEHRRSRHQPPAPCLPSDCSDLLRAAAKGDPLEAALCQAGLHFAYEDLR